MATTTTSQAPLYGAIGGAVLGAGAGAFASPSKPKRVLWGLGGFLLGAIAGGVGGTLYRGATASAPATTGAGALPSAHVQINAQLQPQSA